jgi:hypothetical protein
MPRFQAKQDLNNTFWYHPFVEEKKFGHLLNDPTIGR